MSKLWKKNEVKVDITSYMQYIRGIKKVGKSTLFKELIEELYNDMNKGLLISLGDEDGYKALNGLIVAKASTWLEFEELVDELVENPQDNEFTFLALDTVDELFQLATEEVFRLHKKKYNEVCESLNSALKGYGAGRAKVKELVREQVARLKGSYGLFCIGHTKLRDVNEKGMAEAYQQLTTSLPFDFDSVIADKADIIATISIDKEVIDAEEVNGKMVGSLGGITRWIHFRDDNFNVDCGARFADIVDKVELSAENYIKAIEDAIKTASGISEDEIVKKKEVEVKQRVEIAEQKAEEYKGVDEVKNKELAEIIKEKFPKTDADTKVKVKDILTSNEIKLGSPEDAPTVELQKAVELLLQAEKK